jgi:glycosyltransferase 2 family protein
VKEGIKKTITAALKIIVSVGALVYVFSKIDLSQVFEIAKSTNYFLVTTALIFFILSKAIAAERLNILFSGIQILLSRAHNLKLYLLGMFYNLFLPGGIGGDGYKVYVLNRIFEVKAAKIFWAVFTDRLSGVVALFSLAMIFAIFIDFGLGFDTRLPALLLIPLSLVAFYMILRLFLRYFVNLFLKIISLSLVVQILQVLCAYMILMAIHENGNVNEYFFLFLISSIVAMLPITIGGAGSREITFLLGSGMLGLNENISIALSLIFYMITLFTSFWGILYSFKSGYFERILKTG